MIAWHRAHSPAQTNEETNKISLILKEFETGEYNLGTIICGDFYCDLQDQQQWKKLKEQLGLKVKLIVNQKARKNKHLEELLITYKLRKQCDKIDEYAKDNLNNPSDHLPIAIRIALKIKKAII